jgi:hypothetical protein
MKPREPKNRGKKGGKRRAIKNQTEERRKGHKTLSEKSKKGQIIFKDIRKYLKSAK